MMPVFTAEQFHLFKDIFLRYCGIVVTNTKLEQIFPLIQSFIVQSARYKDFNDLLNFLRFEDFSHVEKQKLIEFLIVTETSFFRNSGHFHALRKILERTAVNRAGRGQKVNIWSVPCCSGEEIYSIAILCKEVFKDNFTLHCELLGTDISTEVLEKAKKGRYSANRVKNMSPEYLEKYFTFDQGYYQLHEKIKQSVVLKEYNVLEPGLPQPSTGKWDIIFCKNLFIYFNHETIGQVIQNFYNNLADNGYLFLGYSETLTNIPNDFTIIWFEETFIYQKTKQHDTVLTFPEKDRQVTAETEPVIVNTDWEMGSADEYKNEMKDAYKRARKANRDNDNREAWEIIKPYLDRRSYQITYLAASILSDQTHYDEALKYCLRSIKLNSLFDRSHFLLATLYMVKDKTDLSIAHFENAKLLHDRNILAYYYLGNLYRKKNEYKRASINYVEGLKKLEKLTDFKHELKTLLKEGFTAENLEHLFINGLEKCEKNISFE